MASNPNIILQGQPVDTGNILNSFLVGRKLGQENRAIEKQNKLAEVLASTPREKLVDTLYQQGMFKEAQDYSKNQADVAKTEAETKVKDFEYRSKMLDASLNLTNAFANDPMLNKEKMLSELSLLKNSGVIDDTVYQQSSGHIAELPDDTLSLRNWAQQTQRRLIGAKESMQYQMPDANAQLQAQTSMTNAQLSADTQRRGQDMSAETQRGGQQFNYDLGMQRLENDRQKTALTGLKQPGMAKVTEDQGKAMGWLNQADNAYKNMIAVISKNKDSMNPGLMETLAPESVKGAFRGEDRQKFVQATSSLSEALLRAATGAGITKDEAAQKIKEITPEYFDKEETKQQKLASIPIFLESLKTRAGAQASGYQVPQWQKPDDWDQFMQEMGGR